MYAFVQQMPYDTKTRAEKVKDTITILQKLQEVGIPKTDTGYILTKEVMDAWIAKDEAGEFKIPFPRHGRTGILTLSNKTGRTPTFLLKVDRI